MNINEKCQLAAVAFLNAASLTTIPAGQIYPGINGSDTDADTTEEPKVKLPCVIVDTGSADPVAPPSNNWKVPLTFRIRTQADDETSTEHASRVNEVLSKIITTTIADDLSGSLSNFTAFLVWPSPYQAGPSDRHWESSYTVDVTCVPADVA